MLAALNANRKVRKNHRSWSRRQLWSILPIYLLAWGRMVHC